MPQAGCFHEMVVVRIGQRPRQLPQLAAVGSLEPRHLAHAVFQFPPLLTGQFWRPLSRRSASAECLERRLEGGIPAGGLLEKRKRSRRRIGPPVDFMEKLHRSSLLQEIEMLDEWPRLLEKPATKTGKCGPACRCAPHESRDHQRRRSDPGQRRRAGGDSRPMLRGDRDHFDRCGGRPRRWRRPRQ